jgi:hypothetical protein
MEAEDHCSDVDPGYDHGSNGRHPPHRPLSAHRRDQHSCACPETIAGTYIVCAVHRGCNLWAAVCCHEEGGAEGDHRGGLRVPESGSGAVPQ